MFRIKSSKICLLVTVAVFFISSKLIFDKVNLTSQIIVDEEFHLPLGKAYCGYDFKKWHPKVTTFPGLYLLSSFIFGAFNLCSTYWLRFTSLIFSTINLVLFYWYLNMNNEDPRWKNIVSALNLALLPPLYFFSHFYYTDVASLTMILLLFIAAKADQHFAASLCGFLAVLFRQTNIVWVAMAFGCCTLKELNALVTNRPKRLGVALKDVPRLLRALPDALGKTNQTFWLNSACYSAVLGAFALFVVLNGSIVVGDKSAHEATLHFPQLFYFSLFCLFFAWPHFTGESMNFVRFAGRSRGVVLVALLAGLGVVYWNTLVHPYMLADNRHYIFYVWSRFYGKYGLFRYLVTPVYLFAWFVIISKIASRRDVGFLLFFVPCVAAVLVTQRLLELRYFLVPYVLFRTQLRAVSVHSLVCEFVTYGVINAVTWYLFFTKAIDWPEYDYPQRLIW